MAGSSKVFQVSSSPSESSKLFRVRFNYNSSADESASNRLSALLPVDPERSGLHSEEILRFRLTSSSLTKRGLWAIVLWCNFKIRTNLIPDFSGAIRLVELYIYDL